jgi:uncharacterized membrane protein
MTIFALYIASVLVSFYFIKKDLDESDIDFDMIFEIVTLIPFLNLGAMTRVIIDSRKRNK